jgi:hypothetical protein
VDPVQGRVLHGVVAPLNVLLVGSRKPSNPHRLSAGPPLRYAACSLGDARHRVEIALRCDREAGLANVDTQPRELLANLHLFVSRQGRTRRLLAVPQRGIKDP